MSSVNQNLEYDLIVIGGGISGISTVYHLIKNNFRGSIALLEGSDRLGGRIRTSKTVVEEEKIEIGANWIHGIVGNPIYEILYRNKIIDPLNSDKNKSYNIQAKCMDGQDVNSYWIKKLHDVYQEIVRKSDMLFEQRDEEIIDSCHDSLGEYISKEFVNYVEVEVPSEMRDIAMAMFRSMVNRENCITGAHSLDDVSLQFYGRYEELPGGNLTIPKGYCSLIDLLLCDIQLMCNESMSSRVFDLFTNCQVDAVQWPGLGKASSNNQLPLKLICSDGKTFKSKHAIVTASLGYLKQHAHSMFNPPLPDYKLECIKRMGFGTVDKIFLEYSSKNIIAELFRKDGVVTDEMMLLWDHSSTDDLPWYTKVYSIYYISDHCLQLWVTGKEAYALEQLDPDQVNTEITEQLRKFFSNPSFPRADNVIVTGWGKDRFACGSYSHIARTSSPKNIEQLAMPIYTNPDDCAPIIAFAGEATHQKFFSTVHGAFLSGQAAAEHFCQTP